MYDTCDIHGAVTGEELLPLIGTGRVALAVVGLALWLNLANAAVSGQPKMAALFVDLTVQQQTCIIVAICFCGFCLALQLVSEQLLDHHQETSCC
jgi:hypothetical protein